MPDRARWIRLGVLGVLVVALFVVAEVTGLSHRVTLPVIRAHVVAAGAWGALLFVGAFLVGELLHLPGILFVVAGVGIWGRLAGGVLGGTTALASIVMTFSIARAIGGQPLATTANPLLRRVLARVETHPIWTVALLRTLFFLTPSVTYLLALSPIRFRQMLIGSALGLLPPLVVATLVGARALHWLGAG